MHAWGRASPNSSRLALAAMDRESDWMVVPSRSVRSDLKGIREKERGVASRRDDRGRTTAQLGAGGDKIGQPIRLYPDRAARQTLHIPPAADSGVRGVLVVPATATAQVVLLRTPSVRHLLLGSTGEEEGARAREGGGEEVGAGE